MWGDWKTANNMKSRLMKIRVQLLYQFHNELRFDKSAHNMIDDAHS